MKKIFLFVLIISAVSCSHKVKEQGRTPLLEVGGKFLYKDEVEKIIPTNSTIIDSASIADSYIKKWVTDVLMYENAKRNITNLDEINKLVEEYRKTLIIHEYEQALVSERVNENISASESQDFYNSYKSHFLLADNIIQGMLLIVPKNAPKLTEVREWMRKADAPSLENIDDYRLRNAISFDYFMDTWTSFSEIIKKTPIVVNDSRNYVTNTRFAEVSDSTKVYFLRIARAIPSGEIEPYEMVKDKISSIILNKKKSDFIIEFEKSVYNDAVKQGDINYFTNK